MQYVTLLYKEFSAKAYITNFFFFFHAALEA